MAVFDLFSKRQRRARGEVPDVYTYDKIPHEFRVQVIHIIQDAFGVDNYSSQQASSLYSEINKALCREYGVFTLIRNPETDQHALFNFFLQEVSIDRSLDFVEICFHAIKSISENDQYLYSTSRQISPNDAIIELNTRFKEHGIGFQFESSELIRVDSDFIHSDVIKPALSLLREKGFQGANEEFLKAHEHYRHGRLKECLVECLKSFESTMKAICKIRNWQTNPTDTAKALIGVCFSNGLIPSYLEQQFSSLRSVLESGTPTVRNKNAGHGQGPETVTVPSYMARYALNLTAANILFLLEAHGSKNDK